MSRKTLWTLGKELEEYFQELRDGDRSGIRSHQDDWLLARSSHERNMRKLRESLR